MSTERLGRFRKALDLLSNLIRELSGEPQSSVGKSEAGTSDDSAIDSVLAKVDELSDVAKRQAEENKRLRGENKRLTAENTRLSKGVVDRNSVDVESDGRTVDAPEVSWPLDMNDEVTPERVGKANWFGDE
jgi:predicted acyltransferase (DUF342 family)